MNTLKATAYTNSFTDETKAPYYAVINPIGTLSLPDIINRLRAKEIATKNVNGEAFVELVFQEMAMANTEGYTVICSYFRATPLANGPVWGSDLGHPVPANRMKLRVNFTQGELALKAFEQTNVIINEQSAASGPVIQSVTDPTENVPNVVNVGCMVLIQGLRLSLKGDDVTVGIYFIKAADDSEDDRPVIESVNPDENEAEPQSQPAVNAVQEGDEVMIRPTMVYPNSPSKLQFVLPSEVTAGNWKVKVITMSSSASSVLVKEPRANVYSNVVKVQTRRF